MEKRFDPIKNKSSEIIEWVMQSPELPQDEGLQFKIRLCVEEIGENVVNYAYDDGCGYMLVTVNNKDGKLEFSFQDDGVPFNPLEKEDPDITASAEERPVGGLGIYICKQMMDEMSYSYTNGCNQLTMKMGI